MKKWLLSFALLLASVSLAWASPYVSTYYLKGFQMSSGRWVTVTDSIPAGTTFTSRWVPIFGARLVSFQMQATAADSDTVVTVQVANIDTTAGNAITIATAGTTSGGLATGVGVYSNYAGTGGVSWGPAQTRTINVTRFRQSATEYSGIPIRWVKFAVTAPTSGDNTGTTNCGTPCGIAVRSMHSVKILVHVFYGEEGPSGDNVYDPLTGAAQ